MRDGGDAHDGTKRMACCWAPANQKIGDVPAIILDFALILLEILSRARGHMPG